MRGGEGFLTENDLIKKCKKGSREAFNILVSNYQQQVINIAYGKLSNQEDAYDAAQEVFVRFDFPLRIEEKAEVYGCVTLILRNMKRFI